MLSACLILVLLLAAQPARAQAPADSADSADSAWTPIIEHGGVAFSFIFYPYADNEHGGVVVKLVNTNDYAVDYRFEIVFRAGREEHVEAVEGFLGAGQMKTGDAAGLFWIPFRDGRSIGEVGLRGYAVVPRD